MFKALLVDDEEPILRLLRTILQRSGFTVATANCARQAIDMVAHSSYDIVITDVRMETASAGLEVAKAADQASPRPLVVMLTAFPMPASEWQAAGADALFVKGADTIGLPSKLEGLLQQYGAAEHRSAATKN